jgi:long-chain acyl-CoA synthetase
MVDSGAKALVIHADLLARLRQAIPEGVTVLAVPVPEEVRTAYGLGTDAVEMPRDILNWETWRESFVPGGAPLADIPNTIIYTSGTSGTSGTTGRPKGVERGKLTPEQTAMFAAMLARSYGFTALLDNPAEIVTAVVGSIY